MKNENRGTGIKTFSRPIQAAADGTADEIEFRFPTMRNPPTYSTPRRAVLAEAHPSNLLPGARRASQKSRPANGLQDVGRLIRDDEPRFQEGELHDTRRRTRRNPPSWSGSANNQPASWPSWNGCTCIDLDLVPAESSPCTCKAAGARHPRRAYLPRVDRLPLRGCSTAVQRPRTDAGPTDGAGTVSGAASAGARRPPPGAAADCPLRPHPGTATA